MKLVVASMFICLCLGNMNIVENCDVFNKTTKEIDTIIVRAKYDSIVMLPGRGINPANSTIIPGDPLLEELEKKKLLKVDAFRSSIIFTLEGCNTLTYNLPCRNINQEISKISINEIVLLTCVVFKNIKIKDYTGEPPVIVIKVQKPK